MHPCLPRLPWRFGLRRLHTEVTSDRHKLIRALQERGLDTPKPLDWRKEDQNALQVILEWCNVKSQPARGWDQFRT